MAPAEFESSDEEQVIAPVPTAQEEVIPLLPTLPAKDAKAHKESDQNASPTTVYLGRIPHGFTQEAMKSYFAQFGEITHIRHSLNQAGKSRHFAFIQFKFKEVAQIVVDTMHNYLMLGRVLQCRIIPDDKVHAEVWKGGDVEFKKIYQYATRVRNFNKTKGDEQVAKVSKRLVKREVKLREKLAQAGVEYDFPGYEGRETVTKVEDPQVKKQKIVKEVKTKRKPRKTK